jgi:predicted ATPase/DNA-binding SARP family transcriptional activator
MGSLWFGLLGPTVVVDDAGEVEIHGEIRRRLLTRLLVSANRPVPVDRLKDDLWEGDLPASAASTLKSHVSLLRKSLGSGRLSHHNGAYVLHVGPGELDVAAFEREAAAGRDLARSGDYHRAADLFAQALARWRGQALADVAGTGWGEPEAVRLEELRAATLENWMDARLAVGEHQQVVADAETAVAEHPLREGLWAKLITSLYRCGRQAEALEAYQRLRLRLGEDLGILPSPELVALEAAILRQELDNGTAGGHHREPAGRRRATNLPPELTSFVPRPVQLAAIARRLQSPGVVTLTGSGGTGKTRLALRAARDAEGSFDGVWLCELAPVEDPARIAGELASAIGCDVPPGGDLLEAVSQRLAVGTQLVILDNCEHLLDSAARLADGLRRAAPGLHVLATSRSPLGVEGEIIYRVPSLSVPADTDVVEDLMTFEAVRLFVERAEAQQPGFVLDDRSGRAVVRICARLEGVALALELAAARLRTMSLDDVELRLHDRFQLLTSGARTAPSRQRTLAALIDWSYDLLDETERRSLRRLAILPSGFDLLAAEAVAAGEGAGGVVDLVASLVDKSLLQLDAGAGLTRYRMLETVREYALGKLGDDEGDDARAAAARHFLVRVETAADEFPESDRSAWRDRLEPDDENLRAAFTTLLAGPDPEEGLRFGAAVSKYWNSRGLYGDEMGLLEAALDRPDASAPTAARCEALAAAGYLHFRRGENAKAQRRLDEALLIAAELDSSARRADVLRTMAWISDRRGDHEAAMSQAQAALDAALDSKKDHLIARAYDVRAAASQHHDPAAARRDYAEALRYCHAAGDRLGQAGALNNLAVLELEQGDHEAARDYFVEALEIAEEVGDAALIPFLEYGVGLTAVVAHDLDAAEPALERAFDAARRTGQRSLLAYTVLGLALLDAAGDRRADAAVLLGVSAALFEEAGEQPERFEATLRDAATTSLRESLGDGFERAVRRGRRAGPAGVTRMATGRL